MLTKFHLHVDASKIVIVIVLAQPREVNVEHLICYARIKSNKAERNYSTIEREGIGMVLALQFFLHYLIHLYYLHIIKKSRSQFVKK